MQLTRPEFVGLSSERLERVYRTMQRHVDQGRIAGVQMLVARCGTPVFFKSAGWMDLENQRPMEPDAIFRIYSMTKPITTTAVMMLHEEGLFRLSDPISDYLPEFKDMQVIAQLTGPCDSAIARLEDARKPITIRHLLTHTAGLSYGFDEHDYLDRLYQEKVWKALDASPNPNLKEFVGAAASLPLKFQPGSAFNYSIAIDVLGYLVEVISGMSFDRFLHERIFEPLGMVDTDFWVPPEKAQRLAHVYGPDEKNPGCLKDLEPQDTNHYLKPTTFYSGGGGLVSTSADYLRFCQMILNKGEAEGVRLLGRKTVDLMTLNHLPNGVFIDPDCSTGFGLGGFVRMDVAKSQLLGSAGSWGWGGAADTKFWIDFQEELIGILMLQYMPSNILPMEADFMTTVYQALI
jgi:CubicO group peptidase (beta-lactamase class C family)